MLLFLLCTFIFPTGTYPKNNGETEMTACMANEYYDCADSWTVKVKNCYDMYNVAYLKPLDDCARICKGKFLNSK